MEKAIYRIIDANFNRAREALRVMEEYCRFYLNSEPLSRRAKQLRHRVSAAVGSLDQERLLMSRESGSDVGRSMSVEGQLRRQDLAQCAVAACKRLSEAMRVLSEVAGMVEPGLYAELEEVRFEGYSLEKDMQRTGRVRAMFSGVRLYVLLTVAPEDSDDDVLRVARAALTGGADCVQLRAKRFDDRRLYSLALRMTEQCIAAGALSIINDRPDLAVSAGAHGVHVGQGDMPVEAARRVSDRLLVGSSTHNMKELETAIENQTDYVGIGPAFDTSTKPWEKTAGPEYLKAALERLAETGIYPVAIGGITTENISDLIDLGIRCAAVCGQVQHADDPEAVCRELKKKLDKTD